MRSKPETIANVSVKEYCFSKKQIQGVVEASQFKWTFENALLKFLLKKDYELEAGNEYKFTISAKF